MTIGEKKTKTLREVVRILSFQRHKLADFSLEVGSIIYNARAQSDLVIEDHEFSVDTNEVCECSTALVPHPCTCVERTDYTASLINLILEVSNY